MSKRYYKTSKDFVEPEVPYEEGINMIWEITQYDNSANPNVWGPAFWFSLHNGATRYPIKASPVYAERMKGFILGIPVMIPCDSCRDHATAYIEQNYSRLDDIVSGMHNLFNFFVDFHNYVNKRYNKSEMSYTDAYKLYTKKAYVTKLVYGRKYA